MDGLLYVEGLLSAEGMTLGDGVEMFSVLLSAATFFFFWMTNWTVTQCFDSPTHRLKLWAVSLLGCNICVLFYSLPIEFKFNWAGTA